MFVIGRNVEAKVEDGRLIIHCKTNIPGVSYSRALETVYLADTLGTVKVPNTDISVDVYVTRPKPS